MSDRWTIRGVDPEARRLLLEVRDVCGLSTGLLVSDAIRRWYRRLPTIPVFASETSYSATPENSGLHV